MIFRVTFLLSALATGILALQSSYILRPIGYPEIFPTTDPAASTQGNVLVNKFGEDNPFTTDDLPPEAGGDPVLVSILSKLPKDQQPFWLLNWQARKEDMKGPHTYPLERNMFIDGASDMHHSFAKKV